MGRAERNIHSSEAVKRRLESERKELIVYITDRKNEGISGYPTLFESKPEGMFTKYDPLTGRVYVSSYVNQRIKPSDINYAKDIVVAKPPRSEPPKRVVRKKWTPFKDIEAAIRGVSKVYKSYEPDEGIAAKRTNGLIELTNELLVEFDARPLDEDRRQDLANMVDERLYALNMESVRKEIMQKIRGQILSGVERDSLGRINSLASRMKIASAWLKAVQESFFNSKVESKYSRALFALMNEREMERFYLQQALTYAERLYFLDESDFTFRERAQDLQDFCRAVLVPVNIKVAPYRLPALMFTDSVFGFDIREIYNIALVKDQKDSLPLAAAIYDEAPKDDLKRKLLKGAIMLRVALDYGEENLHKNTKSDKI